MAKKKASKKRPKTPRVDASLRTGTALPGVDVVPVPVESIPAIADNLDKVAPVKEVPIKAPTAEKRREVPSFMVGKAFMMQGPDYFAARLPPRVPNSIRFAGVDLGTNCGIAWADYIPEKPDMIHIVMGQWDLSLGPYDSGPLRHVRLKHFLRILSPNVVVYEEVKFTPPAELVKQGINVVMARLSTAAEFLGGLKTTLVTWCEECGVPAQGVAIAEIKKFATGKGNASKVDMIAAANAQFGTNMDAETYEQTGVDNIADAAFCLKIGVDQYREAFQSNATHGAPQ